eukprot:360024-Chlamydomonas_euryale.AAC.5
MRQLALANVTWHVWPPFSNVLNVLTCTSTLGHSSGLSGRPTGALLSLPPAFPTTGLPEALAPAAPAAGAAATSAPGVATSLRTTTPCTAVLVGLQGGSYGSSATAPPPAGRPAAAAAAARPPGCAKLPPAVLALKAVLLLPTLSSCDAVDIDFASDMGQLGALGGGSGGMEVALARYSPGCG